MSCLHSHSGMLNIGSGSLIHLRGEQQIRATRDIFSLSHWVSTPSLNVSTPFILPESQWLFYCTLESILDYPLTIVEALIGYGKTMAVREFLVSRGVGVIWTSFFSVNGIPKAF